MVQFLPGKRNVLTEIGAGVGQGLSEQLPKEVERYQLSKGLQNFAQQSGQMSPMEQLAYLSSIRGITPQMIQSFGELAKQTAQAGALKRGIPGEIKGETAKDLKKEEIGSKFPRKSQEQPTQTGQQPPVSITTIDPIQATTKPYIPKSYDEILDRAGQLYNENPALYKNDPQNAIQAAVTEDTLNQQRSQALQTQRKGEQDVQTRLQSELQAQADRAAVKVPDNVYSDIETRAFDDVRLGKKTELEAAQHYKKELDKISRDYESIRSLGTMKLLTKSASGNKDALRSLQRKFKDRNDLENFADTIITENKLSPSKAYYLAYPSIDEKQLAKQLGNTPELEKKMSFRKGYPEMEIPPEFIREKTLEVSEKLAPLLGQNGSPLAIAEELKARGYDPMEWMRYLDKNKKNLNLNARQERELDKPRDFANTLNDLWMFYWSGLDPIVNEGGATITPEGKKVVSNQEALNTIINVMKGK